MLGGGRHQAPPHAMTASELVVGLRVSSSSTLAQHGGRRTQTQERWPPTAAAADTAQGRPPAAGFPANGRRRRPNAVAHGVAKRIRPPRAAPPGSGCQSRKCRAKAQQTRAPAISCMASFATATPPTPRTGHTHGAALSRSQACAQHQVGSCGTPLATTRFSHCASLSHNISRFSAVSDLGPLLRVQNFEEQEIRLEHLRGKLYQLRPQFLT